MTKQVKTTIEPRNIPLFRDDPAKWSIIFHTSHGREEFGKYVTKAQARADAKEYGLVISQ